MALGPMKRKVLPETLSGDRITLRPITPADITSVLAYSSDPDVTTYLPWHPTVDAMVVRMFLQQQQERRRKGTSFGYAVTERSTGEMIGAIDLMGLQSGHPGNCELGYVFRRESWGHGYATEAGALLLDAAFQNTGILVVDAYADADNVGSQRVMEKLGMHRMNSELRIVKGRERIYFHYAIARTQYAACPVLGVAL